MVAQLAALSLGMQFEAGIDENGKPIVVNVRINGLRTDLTDEQLLQISNVFKSLVKHQFIYCWFDKRYNAFEI